MCIEFIFKEHLGKDKVDELNENVLRYGRVQVPVTGTENVKKKERKRAMLEFSKDLLPAA